MNGDDRATGSVGAAAGVAEDPPLLEAGEGAFSCSWRRSRAWSRLNQAYFSARSLCGGGCGWRLQLRGVVERLNTTGQWQSGDPDIVIVTDAGYDVTRLAWILQDLPVELFGRIRGDRVMRLPEPPRVYDPRGGV
ncbi:transposase [Streptomyces sp. NPDC059697]|uniref:transposase n=1 Tax=Streptomyces sp. NPDC059697 TaxID=3346912 RepID=UPI00369F5B1F